MRRNDIDVAVRMTVDQIEHLADGLAAGIRYEVLTNEEAKVDSPAGVVNLWRKMRDSFIEVRLRTGRDSLEFLEGCVEAFDYDSQIIDVLLRSLPPAADKGGRTR